MGRALMPASGMLSWRRWRSTDGALFVLLGLALVYSYWTYLWLPLTRPSPQDYAQATEYVSSQFQPGDLIDANPSWAARAREYLGDRPLVAWRRLDGEDLTPYSRLWLFSLFGAEARKPVRDGLAGRTDLLEERRFGGIDVRLYRVRDHRPVVYDFRERLERAAVWIEAGTRRHECRIWEGGRWRCGQEAWNCVGREILEVGDEPRLVIWPHPAEWGTLAVEFREVPLGNALAIGAGFTPAGVRKGGLPVSLSLEVDGRPFWSRSYEPRSGFFRDLVGTGPLGGPSRTVTFRVRTSDDRLRNFVFAAAVRD